MTDNSNAPEAITRDNCRVFLAALMDREGAESKAVAKAIGCGQGTVERILAGKTAPSDDMLKQVGILSALGFSRYKKLSDAEKEKISEAIGAVSGAGLGFAGITAAVSAAGVVTGLSAAGIASGLAAIGALVGGGMVAGIVAVAAIPIAAGAAGYAIIKGIKAIFDGKGIEDERYDPAWELPLDK